MYVILQWHNYSGYLFYLLPFNLFIGCYCRLCDIQWHNNIYCLIICICWAWRHSHQFQAATESVYFSWFLSASTRNQNQNQTGIQILKSNLSHPPQMCQETKNIHKKFDDAKCCLHNINILFEYLLILFLFFSRFLFGNNCNIFWYWPLILCCLDS